MTPRQIVAWTVRAVESIARAFSAGREFLVPGSLWGLEMEDGPIPRKLSL